MMSGAGGPLNQETERLGDPMGPQKVGLMRHMTNLLCIPVIKSGLNYQISQVYMGCIPNYHLVILTYMENQ
jgi:hypothetical protein